MEEPQSKRAKFTEASSSSTSVTGNNYYVFLSFRGPDTRNGFVDHLYQRLQDVGLPFHPNFVFRDDEDLSFGEKIGENLISAIEHSKVSIPVISENYAASEWCLRELIHIMECKESRGQIVLPVLYKVKPYEVRELKGAFGEAFESRKDRFDEQVKQQGPMALRKALDLRVFESEKFANGREGELVKELVRVIMDERQHDFLPPLPGNLVEIDDRVAEEENENIEALRLNRRGSREFMKRESFRKMPNLKFLHIKDVDFDGDFKGSLVKLRWLKWEKCPDSFKATNVHLEKLVVLDLSDYGYFGINYFSENWSGWSSIKMERLKVLNLSSCTKLKRTPNLFAFKNLEMLILECCAGLKEIHPSIGDVKRLISLNLKLCVSLKKLPEQLSELENLEELIVDETGIKEIPPCIGCLKQLKRLSAQGCHQLIEVLASSIEMPEELVELDLSETRVKKLPKFIGELNKLKILSIHGSNIKRLPRSIGKSQSLQELDAGLCELEGQIFVDKGGLSSLKTLDLAFANISRLPKNLDQLSSLENLHLLGCDKLESLPKPPFSLSSLVLTCRSKELLSLSHLKNLKQLVLWNCKSLQSIRELPSCIQELSIEDCPKVERLANLYDLEFLSRLELRVCNGLKQLDGLETLKSLRTLILSTYPYFTDADPNNLQDNLHEIRGLEKLRFLEWLDISGHKHIQVLDLSKLEHLKALNVRDCESLVEIRCPSKFLKHFDRRGCESLKKLPDFLPHDGLWLDPHKEDKGFWYFGHL